MRPVYSLAQRDERAAQAPFILIFRVILVVLLATAALLLPLNFAAWMETRVNARLLSSDATPRETPPLRVAMMVHPTIYYTDPNGEAAGLEYDLASAFAKTQALKLLLKTFPTPDAARLALLRGEVDMVAMGVAADSLSATEVPTQARYHESAWVLLNSPQKFTPKSFAELLPKRVIVSSRIFSHSRMAEVKRRNPSILFVLDTKLDDESLIAAVGDEEVEYAIVEEDTYNASRHFHYDAQRAFVVQPALPRVWLFSHDSALLRDAANEFLTRITRDGQIVRVLDRYFGFPMKVSAGDINVFTERINTLLPRYKVWFQQAQETYGIEWRLLAALAYQESHWTDDATSETGVRGIMQFTEDTAKRFGVDRLDPRSSILGGARYLAEIKRDGLSARIQEPDKTWLALAAYNIGPGHIENARILTQRAKKNADTWPDVRRHLPLLTKPEISAQFKHGPCRCNMPVEYVEAVRVYYDVLLRMEPAYQPRIRIHG
jgi:membrane-bound lytic murein transglycosylase F